MFWGLGICSILVFQLVSHKHFRFRFIKHFSWIINRSLQRHWWLFCTLLIFYVKSLGHTISYIVKILMNTKIACDSRIIHTCWLHWDRRSQSQEPPRTRPPPSSTALATMAAMLAAFNPLRLWPPEGGARPPPVSMVKQPLESPEGSGSRHLTVHSFAGSFSEIEIYCVNNIPIIICTLSVNSSCNKGAIDIFLSFGVYF